jgi:HEAT repeat protein
MKLRTKILGASIVALLCIFVIWLSLCSSERRYQGKTLRQWTTQLQVSTVEMDMKSRSEAVAALRSIGTNAIPYLLADLRYETSGLKMRTAQLSANFHFPDWAIPKNWENQNYIKEQGVLGFRALGELAAPAIPELAVLLTNGENHIQAAVVLAGFKDKAVPVLIMALKSPSKQSRHDVLFALGQIGVAARPAVPDLLNLSQREPELRQMIGQQLQLIDRQAYLEFEFGAALPEMIRTKSIEP